MNSLHPHWHATDEGERSVPVRAAKKFKNIPLPGVQPISRKPAALLGMLIVTAVGITLFNSTPEVTGELLGNTVTVHITDEGFDPPSITVKHGDTIQWINEQAIPNIIVSTTLCNQAQECLNTPIAFQGDQVEFRVTTDIPSGTYTYSSATQPNLEGEIIVNAQSAPPPPPDNPPPPLPQEPEDPAPPPPPLNAALSPPEQDIPTNPNTNGNTSFTPPTNPNHAGAPPPVNGHKPFAQPQTGAGTWIVSLIFLTSAALLAWGTRRVFR